MYNVDCANVDSPSPRWDPRSTQEHCVQPSLNNRDSATTPLQLPVESESPIPRSGTNPSDPLGPGAGGSIGLGAVGSLGVISWTARITSLCTAAGRGLSGRLDFL
jgi:hypothetical protein